jgi:hypothetical protein
MTADLIPPLLGVTADTLHSPSRGASSAGRAKQRERDKLLWGGGEADAAMQKALQSLKEELGPCFTVERVTKELAQKHLAVALGGAALCTGTVTLPPHGAGLVSLHVKVIHPPPLFEKKKGCTVEESPLDPAVFRAFLSDLRHGRSLGSKYWSSSRNLTALTTRVLMGKATARRPPDKQQRTHLVDQERVDIVQGHVFAVIDLGAHSNVSVTLFHAASALATSGLRVLGHHHFSERYRRNLMRCGRRSLETKLGLETGQHRVERVYGELHYIERVVRWIRTHTDAGVTGLGQPILIVGSGMSNKDSAGSRRVMAALEKEFPTVYSSEHNTSARCPCCGGKTEIFNRSGEKHFRSKICTNPSCSTVGTIRPSTRPPPAAPDPSLASAAMEVDETSTGGGSSLGCPSGERSSESSAPPGPSPAASSAMEVDSGGCEPPGESSAAPEPSPASSSATDPSLQRVPLAMNRDYMATFGIFTIWLCSFLDIETPPWYLPEAKRPNVTAAAASVPEGAAKKRQRTVSAGTAAKAAATGAVKKPKAAGAEGAKAAKAAEKAAEKAAKAAEKAAKAAEKAAKAAEKAADKAAKATDKAAKAAEKAAKAAATAGAGKVVPGASAKAVHGGSEGRNSETIKRR